MNYSPKALDAIKDWQKSTDAFYIGGPFFARDFGDDGMVILEIKNWSEGISLGLIKTPPEYRGKGLASRALKELASFADKHMVPITGSVKQLKDEGPTLNNRQLKQWYSRHGFTINRDSIIRTPAPAHVAEALLGEESPDQSAKEFILRQKHIGEIRARDVKVGDKIEIKRTFPPVIGRVTSVKHTPKGNAVISLERSQGTLPLDAWVILHT